MSPGEENTLPGIWLATSGVVTYYTWSRKVLGVLVVWERLNDVKLPRCNIKKIRNDDRDNKKTTINWQKTNWKGWKTKTKRQKLQRDIQWLQDDTEELQRHTEWLQRDAKGWQNETKQQRRAWLEIHAKRLQNDMGWLQHMKRTQTVANKMHKDIKELNVTKKLQTEKCQNDTKRLQI